MTEYRGYTVTSKETWDKFEVKPFHTKKLEENDVELKISHCGVCGSDV